MRFLRIVLCVWMVATFGLCARAQAGPSRAGKPAAKTGSLNGMVSDLTGNPIAGALIKATDDKGVSHTATTDAKGNYQISGLPPGTYDLTASAAGFKEFSASGLILGPGDTLPIDVAFEPESAAPTAAVPAPVAPTTAPPPAEPAPATEVAPAAQQPQGAAPMPTVQAGPAMGTVKGAISGTVSDQTGAVVAGATVTAVSVSGGEPRKTTTEANGTYVLKLPPGTYNISISAPGFKTSEVPNLAVAEEGFPLDTGLEPVRMHEEVRALLAQPGQPVYLVCYRRGLDVARGLLRGYGLEPAGEKTEVNVESQGAAAVNTETAQVSGTITQKEVQTLQLNGRNFTQLIALAPGVSNQTGQDEAKVGVTGSVKYSVNGGRVEYNTFEVDGSDVLNAGLNGAESTLMVYPSLDSIQEVKVLTSNYGAMYGRTASGTVQVTTKAGARDFHGNAYYYLRNEALNARNYFDQTKSAPLYRRHDFGFTIGGPIFIPKVYNTKKDKTFFFWSTEFRIEKSPSELTPTFNHAVPTVEERAGNFNDVCPIYGTAPPTGFLIAQYPDCPGVVSAPGISRTPYHNNSLADPQSGKLDPAAR